MLAIWAQRGKNGILTRAVRYRIVTEMRTSALNFQSIGKIDRLPDIIDMKKKVVIQRVHLDAFDHAIRTAGIIFKEVGYLGYPGAGGTFGW